MKNTDNFEINYWGKDFQNIYTEEDYLPKRTLKQKLLIVFSFISVLAILPTTIFTITTFNQNNGEKISSAIEAPIPSPTKEVEITPKITRPDTVEIINNDSYWKISKRACGTGKYYLSIQEQNEGKALYKGEFVKVDCSL